VRFACIKRHREEFDVRLMCRMLNVSASGFYAWLKRGPSKRELSNRRLAIDIRAAHAKSRKRYGSPRICRELRKNGVRVSENRVARRMRVEGIQAKHRRKFRVTTNSDHAQPVNENVLGRKFSVEQNREPNRAWVSDITYMPTREGWLYLAVVLDLCSRMVVGWSMSYTLHRGLVIAALEMAIGRRHLLPGALGHSDQGSQYASGDHQLLMTSRGMICSMSRKGDCWDNAVAESFFATLKLELLFGTDWRTREEARAQISSTSRCGTIESECIPVWAT
jgi:putative transposase